MQEIKIKNIIEKIYQAEEKELDEKVKELNKKMKDRIKNISIETLKETGKQKEIEKLLDQIEDNYSIKIAEYNKEFYKQGFIDGVNLIINCIKINN